MQHFYRFSHPLAILAGALGLALAWGALAPLRAADGAGSHALLFEVRPGPGMPSTVRLTLGVQDVLLLRNGTAAPLVFGPVQLAPGGEFRLPFDAAGEQAIPCPALPGGALRVRVVPLPDPGWERLHWRFGRLGEVIRTLPLRAPGD